MQQPNPSSESSLTAWASSICLCPYPTDEWRLCVCLQHFWLSLFIIPPSRCIFSGIQALHVEQGLADSLKNTLRLQWVIRGIKWSQGLLSSTHLSIMNNNMMVIWQSLNIACSAHCMFWASCTIGYFRFLHSAEFTVSSLASFSTSLHLTVQVIAVDAILAPSCMGIRIKAS